MNRLEMNPTLNVKDQFRQIIKAAFPDTWEGMKIKPWRIETQGVTFTANTSHPVYRGEPKLTGISMSARTGYLVFLRRAVTVRGRGKKSTTTPYIDLTALTEKFNELAEYAAEYKILADEQKARRDKTDALVLLVTDVVEKAGLYILASRQEGKAVIHVPVTSEQQAGDIAALIATWSKE